jgi:hypothetical protein
MAGNEQELTLPHDVVLATDVFIEEAEKIAAELAERDAIQFISFPTQSQWRQDNFVSSVLNDPPIHQTATDAISFYMRTYRSWGKIMRFSYNMVLRTQTLNSTLPSYPGRDSFRNLIILRADDISAEELLGSKS